MFDDPADSLLPQLSSGWDRYKVLTLGTLWTFLLRQLAMTFVLNQDFQLIPFKNHADSLVVCPVCDPQTGRPHKLQHNYHSQPRELLGEDDGRRGGD